MSKNRVSFLIGLVNAINKINRIIYIKYYGPENNSLRQEINQFLTRCIDKAFEQAKLLSSKEGQLHFKNSLINDVHDYKFTHRLFDTEKHFIIRAILNAFLLIPVFGLIKLATTGSYFFSKETCRASFIAKNVNELLVLPSRNVMPSKWGIS